MRKFIVVFFLIVISLGAAFPIFNEEGLFPIHDDTQPARIIEMSRSIADGQIPVRFVSELGYGSGYPLFNFYSPLPYYIGAFIYLFTTNAVLATKFMFVIGIMISSFSMYLLAREFIGDVEAFVPAVLYTYNPYHAVEIYVRGSVGEYYAYGFIPLVVLFLYKALKTKSKNWIALSSLSLSLLILSHNITAMIVYLFAFIVVTVIGINSLIRKSMIKDLKVFVFVFLIPILLSAFFILPALFESKYTNVASITTGGSVYSDHFVYLDQLWDSPWGYAGSSPGRADGITFKIGKLQILLGLLGILSLFILIYKKKKINPYVIYIGLVLLTFLIISVFMTLGITQSIWDLGQSFLKYIQFPWRFLLFIEFFLAFFSLYLFYLTNNRFYRYLISFALVFGVIIINYKYFTPQTFFNYDTSYYESSLYQREIVSSISDEYLPRDYIKLDTLINQDLIYSSPDSVYTINQKRSNIVDVMVNQRQEELITINRTFFPGFVLYIDGVSADYQSNSGRISFILPEGLHRIVLIYQGSLIQNFGNMVSCITLVALVLITTRSNHHRKNE